MRQIVRNDGPTNVILGKDRSRNLYIAHFDSQQVDPRVTIGSTWIGHDKRYDRRFLMRVVESAYNEDYDRQRILSLVRENPDAPFDKRSLEYYCSEQVWLRLEGELQAGGLVEVYDQPTVWRTFLTPTRLTDDLVIAAPDIDRGFVVGHLRSGARRLRPVVTLEDRFVGHRTLISGASGFGKSTLVRNIVRYWLEDTNYGKIIDDLKGEYVGDIKNEDGERVSGLMHHNKARENLFLLTSRPRSFEHIAGQIGGVITLSFDVDDIPPENLSDVATHLTDPQRAFLDTHEEKPGLFKMLLRENPDGSVFTSDWHQQFKDWIIATKTGRNNMADEDYVPRLSDFDRSSYTPIFGVRKQLKRLASRRYVNSQGESCLEQVRRLLRQGATIILDKSGLTDGDKSIVSTVLANELYNHNERYSSGTLTEQRNVIPFVYLVEEAHLLLSREKASEGSVFVNFAKTGRSFRIGLVAVTQRPSSVDTNILSQFDNFITFRLTNEQDVKDLIRAKSEFQGYDGDIRTMGRGAAVTAFGEPAKVQSIQVFEWTQQRAKTALSEEQAALMAQQRELIAEPPLVQANGEGDSA